MDLTCPDCGGIIGGDPAHGKVCTCFNSSTRTTQQEAEPESPTSSGASAGSDTSVVGEPAPPVKVCCQCGKDLTGKKRLRDSRGYWCYACHKLDQEANRAQGVRCADCGRLVAESALTEYNGSRICSQCRADRKDFEREKRRLGPVDTQHHKEHDKRALYWLSGVLALLFLVIILHWLKIIGSPF